MDSLEQLETFLESKIYTKLHLKLTAPDVMVGALELVGATVDIDSMDTNGWQYDWWINAEYKGQKLQLSGSGYYGNGLVAKVDKWFNQ